MRNYRAPWSATGWKETIVNNAEGNTLACCPTPYAYAPLDEVQAIARLIAAAPELLESVRELLEHIQWHRRQAGETTGANDCTLRAIAAIKKVEEGTP